jgi:hypothetical protein
VKMITPTSGSSRAKSNARFSSITVRGLNAFLRSGLLMVILAMPSPSAFSYKISSKGGPDGRRGCVQAGSSRDTEPCSCSYLLDLRRGVGGGVSEAEQEESCSRDEDDGSTSVEACCCWQEGEMCRAIVAILCNAASSLRSMATMQKPQQTNKQTIDGRIVLLGLLFNFLTRTNRSLLAHQRSKQETKAMTKYVKRKWQNEDSRERKRERERERERMDNES